MLIITSFIEHRLGNLINLKTKKNLRPHRVNFYVGAINLIEQVYADIRLDIQAT